MTDKEMGFKMSDNAIFEALLEEFTKADANKGFLDAIDDILLSESLKNFSRNDARLEDVIEAEATDPINWDEAFETAEEDISFEPITRTGGLLTDAQYEAFMEALGDDTYVAPFTIVLDLQGAYNPFFTPIGSQADLSKATDEVLISAMVKDLDYTVDIDGILEKPFIKLPVREKALSSIISTADWHSRPKSIDVTQIEAMLGKDTYSLEEDYEVFGEYKHSRLAFAFLGREVKLRSVEVQPKKSVFSGLGDAVHHRMAEKASRSHVEGLEGRLGSETQEDTHRRLWGLSAVRKFAHV